MIDRDTGGLPVAARLIEFKTDHIRCPTDLPQAMERHRQQTEIYTAALAQLTGLSRDHIHSSILFVALPALVSCAAA